MRACAQCAFSESRAAHSLECRIRAPEPRTYVATWPTVGPDMWPLLMGMLGLGGLRTFEKVKGVA